MSQSKALIHEIKYIIDTKGFLYHMKLEKNLSGPWEIHGYSDIDYAGDYNTKKSVTGYIIMINRVVIACHLTSEK